MIDRLNQPDNYVPCNDNMFWVTTVVKKAYSIISTIIAGDDTQLQSNVTISTQYFRCTKLDELMNQFITEIGPVFDIYLLLKILSF